MPDVRSAAIAKREENGQGAHALVAKYKNDFTTVLPSHIRSDVWVRVGQGALKRGKKFANDPQGRTELEVAALNNPSAFLSAMLDAARLGLEPGTEQFYLTPRKVAGRLEILGIIGWQGYVELMYRAGAVKAVVARIVREKDEYTYDEGVDDVPKHRYEKFAGAKTRGKLVGVYAYAKMMNGSISQVIELGEEDIERIKKSAQGGSSDYSPWQTHPEAMWLKSAVRQLAKWVPTSAERIPPGDVVRVDSHRADQPMALPAPPGGLDEHHVTYDDEGTVEAELVDESTGEVLESAGADQ